MQLCGYLSDSKCSCGWDVGFLQFASCCLQSLSYLFGPGKWPVWQELLSSPQAPCEDVRTGYDQ